MGSFFKVFFACLLALVISGVLAILVLVGVAGALSATEKPVVKQKTVLVLDISEPLGEQGLEDNLDPSTLSFESIPGLHEVIAAIDHAGKDSLVKALYIKGRGNTLGFAAAQELGDAIEHFKASGKKVVAFTDIMPQRSYELLHHASKLYVQPGGIVEWVGLHIEVLFLKNLLDRLYIKPEIFYAGQFKSATEPFRLTKMSEPNKLQYRALMEDVYSSIALSVKKHRGVDTATLSALANGLMVRTAEQALEHGMINGLLYEDGVRDTLRAIAGLKADEDIPFMKISDYHKATKKFTSGDRIAIVYVEGSIVDGKGEDTDIGSDKYRNILSDLRKDSKVKAVVLRVNSPGGSAIASEVIWRELELIRKEKPVVVSMGDYAASGGYYISCGADSIFAQPNTLTGSIGVFTIMVDAQKMFNDKLGINFDGVGTHAYADYGNIARPMTNLERQVAQRDVDSVYAMFKKRVGTARKLNPAKVDSLAQGRVWSGTDALAVGLVDKLGSLQDAISCAARMAKLDDYGLREFPRRFSLLEKLMGKSEEPGVQSMRIVEKQLLPQHAAWLREYKSLSSMANVPQARLPFVIQMP
jgi:protease-4